MKFSPLNLCCTVVTVNDYLAQRDAEWMGRVHRFLGLSVGLIQVFAAKLFWHASIFDF